MALLRDEINPTLTPHVGSVTTENDRKFATVMIEDPRWKYRNDGQLRAPPTFCAVVRNPKNRREVVVRVNDRGPFKDGRVIDLSHAAARKLGISGIAKVEVRRLTHAEIRSGSWKLPAQRVAEAASP